jgi:hypothetical protein
MLKPMTKKEEDLVVKNVVSAVKDISKLNKRGYHYLYLACGFIAHYDIGGFRSHYSAGGGSMFTLRADILQYKNENRWSNFRPSDENFDYYSQKARIYGKIVKAIQ